MPYAANVYTLPPGTTATTLTAIDSSDYNAFVADIEAAQNAARPVVAGGTGATSVSAAKTALIIETKGTAIASAATITITANYHHITGSTGPITDIDFTDAVDGRWAWLIFDSTPTITHNATTLILPGAANIVAAAGDRALFIQDSTDNVICLEYVRAATLASLGGNLGATDNILLRSDGTGGVTAQGSAVTVDDSGNVRSPNAFYVGDSSGNLSGGFVNESDTSKSLTISADTGNAGASSFIRLNVDGSEKVRIDSSGNVGIGTAAPKFKLHVEGNRALLTPSASQYALQISRTDNVDGGSNYQGPFIGSSQSITVPDLLFMNTDGTEKMRLTSAGSLGIGNTPGFALDVTGAIRASLPIIFPTYTVATVPSAATYARGMIYVSNEAGGAVIAFADGTNWRRVTDRAIIS